MITEDYMKYNKQNYVNLNLCKHNRRPLLYVHLYILFCMCVTRHLQK